MDRRLLYAVITIGIILAVTAGIIIIGRGYRFNPQTKALQATGLLVAKSQPDGAQVYVDNHLTSATNTTISLPPGTYEVKITKDGYIPWSKRIKVQGEIVAQADALLLPVAPELRPLTTTGAINPTLSFDGTKLAYGVATSSAQKQGIWILDLSDRPLSLQPAARQIARDNEFVKYSLSKLTWSPDGKQILAEIDGSDYLLQTDLFNEIPVDITLTLDLTLATWENEKKEKDDALFKSLKPKLQLSLKGNTQILAWSPDETKILYTATQSASIPQIITPPLIGTNSQPEERELKEGKIYTYDIKEDKNFFIKDAPGDLFWLPNSAHLVLVEDKKLNIMEYDSTNKSTIFAAPFEDNYVFPFPGNGTRLAILTTLNPNITTPNLYALSLR